MSSVTNLFENASFTSTSETTIIHNVQTEGSSAGVVTFFQCLYLVTIMLVTVIGNALVLYLIGKHLKCTSFTNTFISWLSISDLLESLTCVPLTLTTIARRSWIMGNNVTCALQSTLNNLFAIASTYMLTCIVLDRYLVIAKVPRSDTTTKLANSAIAVSWVVAMLLSVPWYAVKPDPVNASFYKQGYVHCAYVFHVSHSNEGTAHSCVVILVGYVLPTGAMIASCTKTWNVIHRTKTGVQPASMDPTRLRLAGELRTAKTVMILVLVYVCTKLPYIIVGVVHSASGAKISIAADTVFLYTFWTTGAVVPFVYANRNEHFSEFLHIRRHLNAQSFTNIAPSPRLRTVQHTNERTSNAHKGEPASKPSSANTRQLLWQKSTDLFNVFPSHSKEQTDTIAPGNTSQSKQLTETAASSDTQDRFLRAPRVKMGLFAATYDGSRKGSDWSTVTSSTLV